MRHIIVRWWNDLWNAAMSIIVMYQIWRLWPTAEAVTWVSMLILIGLLWNREREVIKLRRTIDTLKE